MLHTKKSLFIALLTGLLTSTAFAAGNRADYDLDDDRLIEINDWADLNELRNSYNNRSLYGSSEGCPDYGCWGYELTTDLDFDTNSDGILDAKDTYWNNAAGWFPIQFAPSVLEGNGYVIRNLMINRPQMNWVGLFEREEGEVRNLGLVNVDITGDTYVGAFAGEMTYGSMTGSFVTGKVQGAGIYVGGLVGRGGQFKAVFSTAKVQASYLGGGLATEFSVAASFSAAKTSLTAMFGAGAAWASASNTYWASDIQGSHDVGTLPSDTSFTPATLAQLKCPTAANNTSCLAGTTLYAGWDQVKDAQGNAYWDFGTKYELPGLVLNGVLYRDGDGNGVLDSDDEPLDTFCMSLDKDRDGVLDSFSSRCAETYPDAIDQFPTNAAVSADNDHDGLADAWNPACDAACQNTSGITLDKFPQDYDNDGFQDRSAPIGNSNLDADSNNNGLIEIWSLNELNSLRTGSLEAAGCPKTLVGSVTKNLCRGYELMVDLDFDTNHDGKLDAQDDFWNGGLGWNPLDISGDFEGNGHLIRNLMVNRPTSAVGGLFGFVKDLHIHNLGLTGNLMSITANVYVGGLVGLMDGGSITGCFTTGRITALSDYAGGLVGAAHGTKLHSVFSTAVVDAKVASGGLIGNTGVDEGTYINTSFAAAKALQSTINFHGLSQWGLATNSYWATDTQLDAAAITNSSQATARPATLAQLKCADSPNNTLCLRGTTLYADWNEATDLDGKPYWSFGNTDQLPGLILNDHVYRDGDGDGVLDDEDAFPKNYCLSVDADKDGVADETNAHCGAFYAYNNNLVIDKFPKHAAVSVDADGDGLADAWNFGCNSSCQANANLVLDKFPQDSNNDGTPDLPDADSDHDGLIEISSLAQLSAIRNNPAAIAQKLPATGCPLVTLYGVTQPLCHGYELVADLDFDTNGDGKLNEQDTYWNGGLGWEPVPLVLATFEGNGHLIRNLMINRTTADSVGLFDQTRESHIRNLGLTGKLMSVTGGGHAGGLVGYMSQGSITGCFTTGQVKGAFAGGLVGNLDGSMTAVFSSAIVDGKSFAGGLAGEAFDAAISASYAVGSYTETFAAPYGGIAGNSYKGAGNNYWAIDAKANAASIYDNGDGAKPATLAQLKCPTAADNITCLIGTKLYADWAQVQDTNGNAYWDFGTNQQLPGLVLNGVLYRDSDGNGVLDMDENKNASSSASATTSSVATSASSQSSSPASSASANSSSAASTAQSSSAAAQSSAPAAAAAKDSAGGSVDLLMLVLLSILGLAWRGKKTSQC